MPASGPLAGLRLVEFASIGPGPYAAMLMADLGAEVIRIERPGAAPPRASDVVLRGRETVTADLKNVSDIAKVRSLLACADGLIEGFRPGVMERLGLGPEPLLAARPTLVYGRVTGWGQSGPLAQTAGHDIGFLAITGALAAIGTAEQAVPPLNLVGDYAGGSMFLVMGMLAALRWAQATGEGQVVDAAICDGAASLMALFHGWAAQGRYAEQRGANLLDGGAAHYRVYRCADGGELAIGPIEPQFFTTFMRILQLDIPAEARLDTRRWPALAEQIGDTLAQRPRAEWLALFDGTDACVAPVLPLSEAIVHPHLAARGTHVTVGDVVQPAPAPRFSATPGRALPAANVIGCLADTLERWAA